MIQWNDFFEVVSREGNDPNFSVVIKFNPEHEIFKGHFPGNPVVPGVCMIQIIKIILGDIYTKDFTMKKASQLKFLAVINPNENRTVTVDLGITNQSSDEITVTGNIYKDELIFLKYKGAFSYRVIN
jgi:3-hydroxyacyl-[acyl-carrier-protein] dehydratase